MVTGTITFSCFAVALVTLVTNGEETSTTKPGSCPVVTNDTVGTCIWRCDFDSQCPGNEKCCSNGCGTVCQKPVCLQIALCIIGYVFDPVLCRCVNPCKNVTCPTGESCHPQMIHCTTPPCSPPAVGRCERTTTRLPTKSTEPVVKPGSCPAVCNDTVGICMEGCRSDGDCPHRQKCCFNGCGHTCQKTVCDIMTKCPAGFVFDRVKCRYVNPCKYVTCPRGQVCVSQFVANGTCEPRPAGICVPRVRICTTMPPCNIRCRWGLKYDRNGCQLCKCYDDPCKDLECSDELVCKPHPLLCFVAPCIPPFVPICVAP